MQPREEISTATEARRSGDGIVKRSPAAEGPAWPSHAGEGAAEESCTAVLAAHSQDAARDNSLWARTARIDAIGTVTFVAMIMSILASWLWHAGVPRVATPTANAEVAGVPATAPEPQRPSVQVENPFDRSEVFELPADATADQAREAVAEFLLERARSRLQQSSPASTRVMRDRVIGSTRIAPESFVTRAAATFK